VVESAWPLLLHTMAADAQQLTRDAVLQACKDALCAISKVVQQPGVLSSVATAEGEKVQPDAQLLKEFAAKQERFRSRVVAAAIQQEVEEVRLVATCMSVQSCVVLCWVSRCAVVGLARCMGRSLRRVAN
jgi:hypothetical protein